MESIEIGRKEQNHKYIFKAIAFVRIEFEEYLGLFIYLIYSRIIFS